MTHHTDTQANATKGGWRRRLAMFLSVLVMPLAIVFGVATPASAAPTGCPSGAMCLWEDKDFKTNGSSYQLQYFVRQIAYFPNYKYIGTNITIDDSVTSLYNNGTQEWAYMYVDPYANYGNKNSYLFSWETNRGNSLLYKSADDVLSSGFFYSCVFGSLNC
jgi:hypothetical protein